MVYGQQAGSFGTAFVNSFVASGAADAANWVGGHTEPQSVQNLAAHALVGCAAAAATGKECGAGAIGGATSAMLAPAIDQVTGIQDGQTRAAVVTALATFAGGAAAQAAGYDGVTAAQAAQNEVTNNYLSHRQVDQFAKELKQCGKGDSACANAVLAKYIEISEKQSGLSPSQLDAYYAQVDAWAAQASGDCQTSACRQQVDAWRTLTKLAASGSEEQTLMNLRGLQLIVKSPAGVALDIGGDVLEAGLNFAPVLAGVRAGAQPALKVADDVYKADRVGSGLKDDIMHRAASFLSQEQLASGRVFQLVGGDGVKRTLLQTPGQLNGKAGIFEYIIDSAGKVTHQRFIVGGKVTGLPNQKVP